MAFGSFLRKATAYAVGATALITAAPVLGAAGVISATGSAVATGVGALAAAHEEYGNSTKKESK